MGEVLPKGRSAGFVQKHCKKQPHDHGMLQTAAKVAFFAEHPKFGYMTKGTAQPSEF